MKADSANFLANNAARIAKYMIPIYITEANADTILESKRATIIGLMYENMLFGNYWHGGVTTVKDASGTTVQTIPYYTAIPVPDSKIWSLTTIAPNALTVNGYSDKVTAKAEMVLTLDGDNIIISSATGSTFAISPDGTSNFNRAKLLQDRKLVLSYKYIDAGGNTCYAQDTLTFRNRLRDGINEWQDENPSHY